MALTVAAVGMSRKGRKKKGRERNREMRERGKISVGESCAAVNDDADKVTLTADYGVVGEAGG